MSQELLKEPATDNITSRQMTEPRSNTAKTIGRRRLLKALAASGGVAISSLPPGRWVKPVIEIGYLPAHAQTSPQPTATPTSRPCDPDNLLWQFLAPLEDPRTNTGVEGASASLIGDKIYVSHGFRGGEVALLSIYDIPTDSWIHGGPTAPDSPIIRSELAGGTALGKHYAIGGRGPNADVEEFDPTTTTWTLRDPLSVARGGLGAASWADRIYAIGGRDGFGFGFGTIFNLTEVYNPITDSWTTLAPMPTSVSDNYATIAHDGKVYVFGGATNASTVIDTVQIYNIVTDTWSLGVPMPTVRAAAMVGVINGKIAVFGGYSPSSGNQVVTELYDPTADTWSLGPDMLQPVSEMAQGVTYNGSGIYAIGTGIFGPSGSVVQILKECF